MVKTGLAIALGGALVSVGLLAPSASAGGCQEASRPSILRGASDGDEPLILGVGVKPPELIERTLPDYPAEERSARVEGTVALEAIIDEEGRVAGIKVLRGIKGHPSFSEAATKAVRKWRYRPATRQGIPVKVYFTVTVRFSRTNELASETL